MDNATYQQKALATLTDSPTHGDYVSADDLYEALTEFSHWSNRLETLKKQIFYGKNLPSEPVSNGITVLKPALLHSLLGIFGEAGEILNAETKEDVANEVGDILWYIAILLDEHGLTFDEVMSGNIEKLSNRYKTGKFTQNEALNRE